MTTMDADAKEAKRRKLEAMMGGAPPSADAFGKPTLPSKPAPPPPSADAEEANPFVCDANEAVVFKLVRSSAEIPTAEAFEPEFTHQIFRDDETIFGYRELSVVIHTQAHLFKSYVHISYAEKIKSALNPADDILGMLQFRSLLPPPIYVTLCICVCTHSYTNINTGAQTRKAMATLSLCVVMYMH